MHQSVFITGAEKGLGLALAECFLRDGYHVHAGAYSSLGGLEALEKDFAGRLTIVNLDVSDHQTVERAAREVSNRTGSLDVLVNNAGVYLQRPVKPLEELDFADGHFQRTMEVNAFGPLKMIQQFLPLLDLGYRKLIINISSESGDLLSCRRVSEYAYCMSKASLNIASKILQNYLKPRGIKVLAINPGWMRTEMGGKDAELEPEHVARSIGDLVSRRWSVDDEVFIDYRGRTTIRTATWRRNFPVLTRLARRSKKAFLQWKVAT